MGGNRCVEASETSPPILLLRVRLALLGRLELSGENGAIDLTSKKLVGLVAYLACTFPEPQSREKLMALLWARALKSGLVQARHRLE